MEKKNRKRYSGITNEEKQNQENTIPERKLLHNKVYLYLTEFFAGMSVMAV